MISSDAAVRHAPLPLSASPLPGTLPASTLLFAVPEPMAEERLPFTVRVVKSRAELDKAVRIRHSAYARHLPELAARLQEPELLDTAPGVVVLLAESKLDGSPLGTVRIQTNAFQPLAVEASVELPRWTRHQRLAEVTRLAITEGRVGRLVKLVLIKACFAYCEREGIDVAIAAGRAPIDRQYTQLLFDDLFPETGPVPLRHAGGVPHRVMAFDIASGEARWKAAGHPLLKFFCNTRHPDIDLGLPMRKAAPRRALRTVGNLGRRFTEQPAA